MSIGAGLSCNVGPGVKVQMAIVGGHCCLPPGSHWLSRRINAASNPTLQTPENDICGVKDFSAIYEPGMGL